jgi:hypothetical protein
MYTFRPVTVDKEGIRQCAALLNVVFPQSDVLNEAYLKWEYADNPAGKIVGFNAFEGDEIAAHYVTQPVVANLFGRETKGLLSLNTATHPNHQGKKLFITLADMTYKYGAENGYEFVFGVANANSTPGFLNKLGFQHVAPLQAKVGIGKIKIVRTAKEYCFERLWPRELLEWRMKNPYHQYKISGSNIYAPTGKYGIKAIMGDFKNELLSNFKSHSLSSINPMKLWMGIDPRIAWKGSMYYEIPQKMRPSPLNLIFKDLTDENRKLDANAVKFRAIDFDAY